MSYRPVTVVRNSSPFGRPLCAAQGCAESTTGSRLEFVHAAVLNLDRPADGLSARDQLQSFGDHDYDGPHADPAVDRQRIVARAVGGFLPVRANRTRWLPGHRIEWTHMSDDGGA